MEIEDLDDKGLCCLFCGFSRETRVALLHAGMERLKQNDKFGDQKHDIYKWLAILGEEVGEVNKAALHTEYGGPEAGNVREELVQVAAVAVKMIENIDRGLL